MKRILITGSSGFIGTNLIERLIKKNNFLILGIDLKSPKIQSHNDYFKQVDIRDEQELKKVMEDFNPNFIIHLAARTDLNGKNIDDYSTNTIGVKILLKLIKELKDIERVIFTSSMYVCAPGYVPKDNDDYSPHTIYGESKVITEKLVKNSSINYIWSIIRPTSIWGPWFGVPYRNFFDIVLSDQYFHMGPKICNKTYGYIGNTVNQILSFIRVDSHLVNEQTFYLGDTPAYNISEWADEIGFMVNKKIRTVPFILFKFAAVFGDLLKCFGVEFPMTSFRLKNMTTDNIYNLDKINQITEEPVIPRKEAVKITLEWMLIDRK